MNNRLTTSELDAILGVAGDALAQETLSSDPTATAEQIKAAILAFETGMEKLRRQLSRRTTGRRRRTPSASGQAQATARP